MSSAWGITDALRAILCASHAAVGARRPRPGLRMAFISLIGYFFAAWQKERDETENNVRLYTQLISQREQSDSQLRTEMFKAVIEKFLSGGKSGDLYDTVLKLV